MLSTTAESQQVKLLTTNTAPVLGTNITVMFSMYAVSMWSFYCNTWDVHFGHFYCLNTQEKEQIQSVVF